jgi:hypothetical protein
MGVRGVVNSSAHTQPAASTSTATALAENHARRSALFVNDSDTVIYLRIDGASAVVNQGIRLNALGGMWEMSEQLGNLNRGVVNMIAASGSSKVLLVTEGVK